ncbi:MAG: hypothetical protein AAGF59_00695 [Pseudomonadota bacterium]
MAIDDRFSDKGLAGNALHEIHGGEARIAGAATGFLAGLLTRNQRRADETERPILWVQGPSSAHETGRLHGPGLYGFGADPGRIILVTARSVGETLWVLEEGFSCAGLQAVVGDLRGDPRALDLTATRRLVLRARKAGRPGFLLRTSAAEAASAARSRWTITPARSLPLGRYTTGPGRAVWKIDLVKNRDGPIGAWIVEWNHHDRSFTQISADSLALASQTADRPDRASTPQNSGGETLVPFRRAS